MHIDLMIKRGKRVQLALCATMLGYVIGTLLMLVGSLATSQERNLGDFRVAFLWIFIGSLIIGFPGWVTGLIVLVLVVGKAQMSFAKLLILGTIIGPVSVAFEFAIGGDSLRDGGVLYAFAAVDAFLITLFYLLLLQRQLRKMVTA